MHGQFSQAGRQNEENPLVFADLATGEYFHIIENDLPGVGHLDGLLATNDSLFVSDVSPLGGFGNSARDRGVIYQIQSTVPDIDVTDDNRVDCQDIEALQSAVLSQSQLSQFDLNRDDVVDRADVEQWLTDASYFHGGSELVYHPGDANLDGQVDGADIQIVLDHFVYGRKLVPGGL